MIRRAIDRGVSIEKLADAGVYTRSYAEALLAATPKSQLLNLEKPRRIRGLDEEQMSRMEAEMESLQREYRLRRTISRWVLEVMNTESIGPWCQIPIHPIQFGAG